MKKVLIALVLGASLLTATGAQAWRGDGWHGGWHRHWYWWSAPLVVGAIAWPYYYSRAYDPYYYPSTTVVVQNPPNYVVSNQPQPTYVQPQPAYSPAPVAQSNNGVIELGPATGAPPPMPQQAAPQGSAPPAGRWFVYPSRGQSDAQLASDQTECSDWATKRSGYDPDMRYNNHPPSAYNDYGRALSACLEGRGYTVR